MYLGKISKESAKVFLRREGGTVADYYTAPLPLTPSTQGLLCSPLG